ncbi:serine hydrolase domain-containing protein [Subtercola vilae]|uniref:Class A beta-lactamase-related serine hydrolase n=1 Tax=Subtercola vilae TaxID=2056433 RepID=A0A4T2BAT7_9MICO|nr:serine hydrolase domain-containing protein [Subtercola vilae]TIH28265.1 class A beta-lactamase-related serine hydrolase [Subtercola vilae]
MAAVLLLAGCANSSSPTGAATSTPDATGAASTCVADPAAVVARTNALPTTPMPANLRATIDAAAQSGFASSSAPGAIVAVQSKDGLFLKAYGVADPATGVPMTTDMYQRVGSITKPFTATLILQLEAAGKLSLDDPISKYVPGVADGHNITLRMLGDMTSGLASYTLDPAWQKAFFAEPEKVWDPNELVSIGLALPPLFAPGTSFNYSNTNTVLLGKVIERVTGQSYQDVLQQKILTPLRLDHTIFPAGSADYPAPHAQGFTLQGNTATVEHPENTTAWNPSWGWSAGELISSAADLTTFVRAMGTGNGLLPAQQQLERLTSSPGAAGYGFGWGCSGGWVGHGGEVPGYNTSMFYDTISDTTVIIMVNSDIPNGGCSDSVTLEGNPSELPCAAPATRVFVSVSAALGHSFSPPPKH